FSMWESAGSHPGRIEEACGAVQLDQFLLTKPGAIGRWLLRDYPLEGMTKSVVAQHGIEDSELAELLRGEAVTHTPQRIENRLSQFFGCSGGFQDLPQPRAASFFALPVIAQVV